MNIKIYFSVLFLLFAFSCSNNGQGAQQSVAEDSLEIVNEFFDGSVNLDTLYQRVEKEMPPIITQFHQLIEDEKYEDALNLYESNKGDIMVFLKTTSAQYYFDESLKHLYYKLYDENEAVQKITELCELEEMLADYAIAAADNDYVPVHYAELLNEMAELYWIADNNEKALEKLEKLGKFVIETEGKENINYAAILFNTALLYEASGKSDKAIQKLRESKDIYEKIDMKDSEEWQNCVDKIGELKIKQSK
jgi:tetratricopeptide (TPR) repeat protein